jgi:hypothetical protein
MTRLVHWPVGLPPGCASSWSELVRTKAHSQLRPGGRSSSLASLSLASLSSDSSLAPVQRQPQRPAQGTRPRATAGRNRRHRCRKTIRSGLRALEPGSPLSRRSARAQGQSQSTLTPRVPHSQPLRVRDSPHAGAGQPTLLLHAYMTPLTVGSAWVPVAVSILRPGEPDGPGEFLAVA